MKTLKDILYKYGNPMGIIDKIYSDLKEEAREEVKEHEVNVKHIESRRQLPETDSGSAYQISDYGLSMYHKGIIVGLKNFFNLEDKKKESERISYKLPNYLLRCFMKSAGTGVTVKTDDGRILELDLTSVKQECKLMCRCKKRR